MGSAEYQVTAIYGRKLGLNFGTDVTVVSAAPPLARAQLEAKRVDAAMLWEPTTTLALRDNPGVSRDHVGRRRLEGDRQHARLESRPRGAG